MGWWETERNGLSVEIGDEVLDITLSALRKIARAYKRDMKRKPTPLEIEETLESSIRVIEEDLFADMDDRGVDSVEIRLRQRPSRQKPKAGDYFAVPLSTGDYGYGHIKGMARGMVLVDFLSVRSSTLLSISQLSKASVVFQCVTGTLGFERYEWILLGSVREKGSPSEKMSGRALASHLEQLGSSYGHEAAVKVLDWYLGGQKGRKPYGDARTA